MTRDLTTKDRGQSQKGGTKGEAEVGVLRGGAVSQGAPPGAGEARTQTLAGPPGGASLPAPRH